MDRIPPQSELPSGPLPVLAEPAIHPLCVTQTTPVLSYASPNFDQPLSSRFACEHHSDGVTLREPPSQSRAVEVYVLGGLFILIGLIALIPGMARALEQESFHHRVDWFIVAIPLMILLSGVFAVVVARINGKRPLIIEVRKGELSIAMPRLLRRHRSWPSGFIADVIVRYDSLSATLQVYSRVILIKRNGSQMSLLGPRSKNECQWIASVLRTELGAGQRMDLTINPDLPPAEVS